jgi:hypothetical protein
MRFLTSDYSSSETVGQYRIDTERRMRIEEYQGQTGLRDLKSVAASMASDPCWSPEFHGLIDFSGAKLDLTANDILRLALIQRLESHRSSGWLAYVATDSLTYGIIRMLGYWSRTTDRLRIFQSRAEAEEWLALNINQVPPAFVREKAIPAATGIRNAG